MKQFKFSFLALALLLLAHILPAQEAYQFKELKRLNTTSVKSQDNTGTCWAFSSASFLESEALRMGKGMHDLSEMFVVRHIYRQKCENYVRRQGKANLSQGGLAHDLLNAVRDYGIVPEMVYPGRNDPSKPFNHSKIEKDLQDLCNGFVNDAQNNKLDPNWLAAVDKRLDEEFGEVPVKFTYDGSVFTPVSFRDYLGIDPDAYVSITSFTHHPYWKPFMLEVPDNFSNGLFYNLPISEMMRCLDNALETGYTVEWDADVSNRGFSAQNGLAIVPEKDWKDKSDAQRAETFKFYEPEHAVSQDYRQDLFDRQVTQDDHLMHIIGMVDEAHSGHYYLVKNSWGPISDLKGMLYTSEAYMRLNTISLVLHRDAIPADIRQKTGLVVNDLPGSNGRARPLESGDIKSMDRANPTPGKIQSSNLTKKPSTPSGNQGTKQ
ncbi:MAG: aminopeptidase [Lewinellaceae bacterium]|nr:aminopeptidase [Lewinellaceae bacterium]